MEWKITVKLEANGDNASFTHLLETNSLKNASFFPQNFDS